MIHAIALSGNATDTNFPGVTCQKLFINPATVLLQVGATANTAGYSGVIYPTGTPLGLVPAIPSAAGVPLWSQAVWADTRSGAMKFTRAVSTVVPKLTKVPKHAVIYQYEDLLKNWWGYGPFLQFTHNPIRRYTK